MKKMCQTGLVDWIFISSREFDYPELSTYVPVLVRFKLQTTTTLGRYVVQVPVGKNLLKTFVLALALEMKQFNILNICTVYCKYEIYKY